MRAVVEGEVDGAWAGGAAVAQEVGELPGGQRAVAGVAQGAQLCVEALQGDGVAAAVVGADVVVGEDDRRTPGGRRLGVRAGAAVAGVGRRGLFGHRVPEGVVLPGGGEGQGHDGRREQSEHGAQQRPPLSASTRPVLTGPVRTGTVASHIHRPRVTTNT
ncbi:hypothetical protein STENM327S_01892 [Streptomyces tendae]